MMPAFHTSGFDRVKRFDQLASKREKPQPMLMESVGWGFFRLVQPVFTGWRKSPVSGISLLLQLHNLWGNEDQQLIFGLAATLALEKPP